MEFRFNVPLPQYTTLLLTSLYMLQTSQIGGMSAERIWTPFDMLSYRLCY
jgi:hypothetical protein